VCVCVCVRRAILRYSVRSHVTKAWHHQHDPQSCAVAVGIVVGWISPLVRTGGHKRYIAYIGS